MPKKAFKSKSEEEKFKRCIAKVKGAKNPYAVCMTMIKKGRTRKKKK